MAEFLENARATRGASMFVNGKMLFSIVILLQVFLRLPPPDHGPMPLHPRRTLFPSPREACFCPCWHPRTDRPSAARRGLTTSRHTRHSSWAKRDHNKNVGQPESPTGSPVAQRTPAMRCHQHVLFSIAGPKSFSDCLETPAEKM